MRGILALSFVLAAVGCTQPTQQQQTFEVCTTLCQCISPLPAQQNKCLSECASAVQADDACFECAFDNGDSCALLIDQCLGICVNPSVP